MMADGYLILTVIFFTIFMSCENPFPASIIFAVGGISILGATAAFLITEAVVYGKAGPAHALTEVQSLYVLILEVLVLGKIPNTLQMIGFVFGFVGGAFIAFESKKEGETKYVPLANKEDEPQQKKLTASDNNKKQ
jgi:drug/metabolite transporter (DMT)-like permease